ncbi:MAG: hypothetical protein AB7O67_24030, partial [Vicinamibacterales bacterium]
MTLAACRASLKAVIGAVSGVVADQVYEQRRIVRSESEIYDRFGNPINGWQISLAPAGPIVSQRGPGFGGLGAPGGGRVMTTYKFQIEGYYGLDDANDSQQTFEDLAEAVVAALNSYGLLPDPSTPGRAIPGLTLQGPCNAELV